MPRLVRMLRIRYVEFEDVQEDIIWECLDCNYTLQ
jgi:hypothetical protein